MRISRLTRLDLNNLLVESARTPMHMAALAVLDGSPGPDAVREHLVRRLHRAPRLRQVLYRPRTGLGPPLWVDDPGFDARDHLHSRVVPAPGDEAALLSLCARLNESPLERTRPLWDLWLLTGLAGGEAGLLIRVHHAMADGLAAVALVGALFDETPEASPAVIAWEPLPRPGTWELFVDNAHRQAAVLSRFRPDRLSAFVRQLRHAFKEGLAPAVSLNHPVREHRRLLLVHGDLGRARAAAHAHGAKVNDVVLAAIAGGARRWLETRGELRPDLVLKASVAVSVRGPGEAREGNRVGVMVAPLPVGEPDPARRLESIARATVVGKSRPPYLPSARWPRRLLSYVMSRQRLVNLLVTDLPGPARPLFFAGARVREVSGIGILQGNLPLSVSVLSYAGQLNFAVVSDFDTTAFAEGLGAALGELNAAAL